MSVRHQTQVIGLAQPHSGWLSLSPVPFRSSVSICFSIPWLFPNYCWTSASILSLVPHKSLLPQWYFRILYIFYSASIVFILPAITALSYWLLVLCCQYPSTFPRRFPLPLLAPLFLGCFCLSSHPFCLRNFCYWLFYLFKLLTADTVSLWLEISLPCLLYLNEAFSRINWFYTFSYFHFLLKKYHPSLLGVHHICCYIVCDLCYCPSEGTDSSTALGCDSFSTVAYTLKQAVSQNPELTISDCPKNSLICSSHMLGISEGPPPPPSFYMTLGIWTLVHILAHQLIYLLSHLPSRFSHKCLSF